MKNVKFGLFSLGLLGAVTAAVAGLGAQSRMPVDFAQGRSFEIAPAMQVEPRVRAERPNVMVLEGRGSQLGVMVSDVDVKAASSGVKIDEVNQDSPAEKAGIKAGDVVVEYDGERVRSARQFTRLVQETPEGRTVAIGLLRDGKKQTVNATPENGRMTWDFGPEMDRALREAERGRRGFRFDVPAPNFDFRFDDRHGREPRRFEYRLPNELRPFLGRSRGRLGVTVQSLTPDLEEYFGAKNGGALVSGVTKESAAAQAGIRAGDVIVSINGRSVGDSDDLIQELEDLDGEVTIVVLRDKKEMTLKATLERPRSTTPRAGSRPGLVL
jgi:membrane-associated protease RseP (regulator of RpoE activity)